MSTKSSRKNTRISPNNQITFFEHRLTKINYKEVATPPVKLKKLLKHISDNVMQNKTPHFHIMFDVENKKDTYFEEMTDGNFKDFVIFANENRCSMHLFKNMLIQLMISILSLHHFGVRKQNFNDIDLQHMTYHETPSRSSHKRYFHYKIFGNDYYIPDCGFVWVFSAIDEIEDNNYKNDQNQNSYITKHKYDEDDDDENYEDEYSILLYHLNILFDKLENKPMQKIIEDLIEVKQDTVIDSFESEKTFFQNALILFAKHNILLKELSPSNIPEPQSLSNTSPYIIHKTKMTFVK